VPRALAFSDGADHTAPTEPPPMRSQLHRALAVVVLLLSAASPVAADFDSCLADLRASAAEKGVARATFDRVMDGVTPDPTVIEAMDKQPEFTMPIWDYMAFLVDEQKVTEGREMMRRHASALASAEARYDVDRYAIAAVWGVESDYGKLAGRWSLPQALSTLACTGPRRRDYFRGELIAALQIVDRGDLDPDALRGSWAGAVGQTQFMPSTYLRLAVDGDGDGRRDLVASTADALHSTANYLAKSGWVTGAPWGYEVKVPRGYAGPSGRTRKEPVSAWTERGVRRIDGSALSGSGSAGLLLPAGPEGPAFLVFKNYDAVYAYNAADSYALAISVLSDRLRGSGGVQTPWPTDDRGLSRAERKEVQEQLLRRGYDIGEADGAIGARTRQAIAEYQGRIGLPRDGRAGGKVLDALRAGR
jgi:lytic murein transglycosylase